MTTRHCATCRCHRTRTVREQLKLRSMRGESIRLQDVAEMVAADTLIPVEAMRGRSQAREVVAARHLAIQLSFAFCTTSVRQIGRAFKRDRATVLYALRRRIA